MGRKKLNLSEEEILERRMRRKEQIKKATAKYKIEKRRCVENLTAEQLERKRKRDRNINLTAEQIDVKRKRAVEYYKRNRENNLKLRRCVESLTAEQLERKREKGRNINLTAAQIENKRRRAAESYKKMKLRTASETSGRQRVMDKLCRICMEKQEVMVDIFESKPPELKLSIADLISLTTGLLVSKGDSQPETICLNCLQNAQIAYDKRQHHRRIEEEEALMKMEVFTITEIKIEKSDGDGEAQQVEFDPRREDSKDDLLDKDGQKTDQFHGHVKIELLEEDFRGQREPFCYSFPAQVKNEPIEEELFEEVVHSFDGEVKIEPTEYFPDHIKIENSKKY